MLRKWMLQNKYKLIAAVIGAYLLFDLVQHKGLVRVLIPKQFDNYTVSQASPKNKNILLNAGKEWVKAVNTIPLMQRVDQQATGLEADIYFDPAWNGFDVHHDVDKSTGLNLEELLGVYQKRGLRSSVWFDFKNLTDANADAALAAMIRIRNKFDLDKRILVESSRADLLKRFSDSGFFTAYYTPQFNPYLDHTDSMKRELEDLTRIINNNDVNALSGYYFQYPFLKHCFPNYPILIWSPNDRYSLVNRWFKWKVAADHAVFVALYP